MKTNLIWMSKNAGYLTAISSCMFTFLFLKDAGSVAVLSKVVRAGSAAPSFFWDLLFTVFRVLLHFTFGTWFTFLFYSYPFFLDLSLHFFLEWDLLNLCHGFLHSLIRDEWLVLLLGFVGTCILFTQYLTISVVLIAFTIAIYYPSYVFISPFLYNMSHIVWL